MFKSSIRVFEKPFQLIFIGLIKAYQLVISPMIGKRCRFYPSCSEYCLQTLKTHNLLFALWLNLKRLLKCHPGHKGGLDPVPPLVRKNRK